MIRTHCIHFLRYLLLIKEGRRNWSLAGQLHYTLLTAFALAILASFWYWNLLAIPS